METIASGSIDLKSLKVADEEVNKYITNIGDDGIKVHPYNNTTGIIDQNNYTKIDSNGMEIWQEDNDTSIKVAEFGADGAIIGKSDGSQSYLYEDYHSLQMVDKEGKTYFWVSDIRDRDGKITDYFVGDGVTRRFKLTRSADSYAHEDVTITIDGEETTAWDVDRYEFVFNVAPETGSIIAIKYLPLSTGSLILPTQLKGYSFGNRKENSTIGGYSLVEGNDNTASGYASHAEGQNTTASGERSHAEGTDTTASGLSSHAEGYNTTASGQDSHAEGDSTTASGVESHAEGDSTTASGYASHSEGNGTTASGYFSHAEGYESVASGRASHAGGYKTISQRAFQTVIGKSNIADTDGTDEMNEGKYALIIGNGSVFIPSNALTVDWSGNVDIADGAKYKINGTNLAPSDLGEADYVTAQGTSGAWKYRKWNSGKVEAWAYISFTSTTPAVWASPIRYIDKTFTIPSGIFASAPRMTGSSNSNQYWAVDVSASSSTAGSVRFCTVASSALTPYIQIYAWTD